MSTMNGIHGSYATLQRECQSMHSCGNKRCIQMHAISSAMDASRDSSGDSHQNSVITSHRPAANLRPASAQRQSSQHQHCRVDSASSWTQDVPTISCLPVMLLALDTHCAQPAPLVRSAVRVRTPLAPRRCHAICPSSASRANFG